MTLDLAHSPYLALILIGFLPSEVWRWLGVELSNGLDDKSELMVWVRAVATATLAAVVAKLLFFPSGALDLQPVELRAGALFVGLVAFLLVRKSVLAGVLMGEATLIGGAYLLSQGWISF